MSMSDQQAAAAMLPLLYRTEEQYGWSVGMRSVTHSLLAGVYLPDGPVVDVGCGGGRLLAEFGRHFPDRDRYGVEINAQALAHASITDGRGAFLQASVHDLPIGEGRFALCLALDMLDQRDVLMERALSECRRILMPGGVLILRVSAHSWLHGPHDAAFNTGRRYEHGEMVQVLRHAGFNVERVTYANTLLSLPEGAVRILQRWRVLPFLPSLYTTHTLNRLLRGALKCEARWLRRRDLPGGMSLYVVARKSPTDSERS